MATGETMVDGDFYRYTESGMDNVYLANGYRFVGAPRGRQIKIRDIDGLHDAIGLMLVDEKKNLNGREIRFLRLEMLMSQAALAHLLEVDEQTVARWEKGKTAVAKPAEALIRLLYREHVGKDAARPWQVRQSLETIAGLEHEIGGRIVLRHGGNRWRAAALQAA
jgi:DNA-binding transcriptional regulator YiaG